MLLTQSISENNERKRRENTDEETNNEIKHFVVVQTSQEQN